MHCVWYGYHGECRLQEKQTNHPKQSIAYRIQDKGRMMKIILVMKPRSCPNKLHQVYDPCDENGIQQQFRPKEDLPFDPR